VTPPASGPRITDPVRDPTPPVVGPPAPPVVAKSACDDELTYAAFGQGFFNTYCVGCHSGGQAPNLGSLSNIAAAKALVAARAIQGVPRIMPPLGMPAPTADEKAKLQQWLNCSPLD
jgi:cytochrome c5